TGEPRRRVSPARRERLDVAAKLRVLDRELLDAGHQQAIQPLLAAEVLLGVLEKPARERQENAPFGEQNRRAGDPAMAGKRQTGLERPVLFVFEDFRQEQGRIVAS